MSELKYPAKLVFSRFLAFSHTCSCKIHQDAYPVNKRAGLCYEHSPALGHPPVCEYKFQAPVWTLLSRGLKRLAVKLYDQTHDNGGYNRSQHVKQKVLHRRHLLVLKLGGRPTRILPRGITKGKAAI